MKFDVNGYVVSINMATRMMLMDEISKHFQRREGFALATVNLDHLVKLADEPAFREAYAAQDLIVADGNPLVWMSNLANEPVELIPGADMVLPLAQLAAHKGVSIALVGSTDEALAGAAKALQRAVSDLTIATCIAPPMGFDPSGASGDEVFEQLETSGAGLAFLALGAPKQEVMAARGREKTPAIGYASIGAGLDFLAGVQVRAPLIFRKLALEWLWRMLTNPRRLAIRYAKCFAILPGHVLRSWQRGRA